MKLFFRGFVKGAGKTLVFACIAAFFYFVPFRLIAQLFGFSLGKLTVWKSIMTSIVVTILLGLFQKRLIALQSFLKEKIKPQK